MTLAEILLEDWNVYMAQTRHVHDREFRQPTRRPTPDNLKMLERMIAWCRSHMIEPRLWLYFLFKGRGWVFPPKFDEGSLQSEKMLKKFGRHKTGFGFFQRRVAASAAERTEGYDPNVDVADAVEALKARYRDTQQQDRCMHEMLESTLGFHPRSGVCVRCPVRVPCAIRIEAAVPFPVVALRLGIITARQAQEIAEARRER